jgi:response regulator RpfG family c-di-GMP phosphodiesterase
MQKNINILVIDDEKSCRDILKLALRIQGYEVVAVDNGLTGWEFLLNEPSRYDLIIMDVMMPGVSGIDISKRIKEHPDFSDIPIILQTGVSSIQDLDDICHTYNDVHFLQKPFERQTLLDKVAETLCDAPSSMATAIDK